MGEKIASITGEDDSLDMGLAQHYTGSISY